MTTQERTDPPPVPGGYTGMPFESRAPEAECHANKRVEELELQLRWLMARCDVDGFVGRSELSEVLQSGVPKVLTETLLRDLKRANAAEKKLKDLEQQFCIEGDYTGEEAPLVLSFKRMAAVIQNLRAQLKEMQELMRGDTERRDYLASIPC